MEEDLLVIYSKVRPLFCVAWIMASQLSKTQQKREISLFYFIIRNHDWQNFIYFCFNKLKYVPYFIHQFQPCEGPTHTLHLLRLEINILVLYSITYSRVSLLHQNIPLKFCLFKQIHKKKVCLKHVLPKIILIQYFLYYNICPNWYHESWMINIIHALHTVNGVYYGYNGQ